MAIKILPIFIFLFSLHAQAVFLLGTGFNSSTAGRLVPSLNLGVGSSSFQVLASSTGVATKTYNHSAYTLGGYWTWNSGPFLLGDIYSGFGVGTLYASRLYQDIGAREQKKSDFAIGPAFFGRWLLADFFYISVEAIIGIGDPSLRLGDMLTLNFRDHVNFSIGFQL